MPSQEEKVAVVMVDLDGFKSVNDGHGHLAGDRLLRDSARVLGTAPAWGPALPVGGDEFAAVLPVDGADEAFAVAQRMHARRRTAEPPGYDDLGRGGGR